MEELNRKKIDRAVLVGLNADCFTKEETATETTLDELEALLKANAFDVQAAETVEADDPAPKVAEKAKPAGEPKPAAQPAEKPALPEAAEGETQGA